MMPKRAQLLLGTAALLSTAMALFHFLVPYLYPWNQHVSSLYPPVRWALFAINFAYSTFLLWSSVLTILLWRRPSSDTFLSNSILGGMGLCWLAGAIYEFFVPFPVDIVRWVLPAFALVTGVLFLACTAGTSDRTNHSSTSSPS